ncbi:MAG: type II toxin-antitoxin system RelE/ParE family toxin [Pyrinomonadaceae bacterium]|nr:type II toxin-antitoxin system RelE/ParE family toxin [Pyrinomonadaceae bacterium]
MSREITKKPQAERDIEECFVYIGEDNLDIAVHFLVAVEDGIEQISRNPFIGSIRNFTNSQIKNLRMWSVRDFTDYQIFYKVEEETIEIIRVLHGARDLPNIFN